MGNYESLVSELHKKLGEVSLLLIEVTAQRTRDLMIESIASAAGGEFASEKATAQHKVKKTKTKRAYTRIDDGSIINLLRDKGPMRLTDIHKEVGGSISNLSKKFALLKAAGVIQIVVIDGEKLYKAARDGRGRVTALPGEKSKGTSKAVKGGKGHRQKSLSPESGTTEKASVGAANENAA